MPTNDERREVAERVRELLAIPWYKRPWSRDAMQSLGEMVMYEDVRKGDDPEVGMVDSVSWHVVLTSDRVALGWGSML